MKIKLLSAVAMLALCVGLRAQTPYTAYAFQAGDDATPGNPRYGYIHFQTDNPDNIVFDKVTQGTDEYVSAAEYFDGTIYAYTIQMDEFGAKEASRFITINPKSYAETYVKQGIDRRVVDMSFDYTTNTMYCLVEKERSNSDISATWLGIVDLQTGDVTPVGTAGNITAVNGYGNTVETYLMALAINSRGELYAMSGLRQLYKLDKHTGLATLIGSQINEPKWTSENQISPSISGIYFQSMSFAPDGTLYYARQSADPNGYFDIVDEVNAKYVNVHKLTIDPVWSGLWFERPFTESPAAAPANFKATNTPSVAPNTVDLTWTLPTTDYKGNAVTITGVHIYRLGDANAPGPIAELPATATSYSDTKAINGTATYEIQVLTAEGVGFPATASVVAGYAQMDKVQEPKAEIDGNKVSITWLAPTSPVGEGYVDTSSFTYNVYRVNVTSGEYVRIAENVSGLTYTDELAETGQWAYVIECVNGTKVGLGNNTNTVLYAKAESIPYSYGFEASETSSPWTINNTAHSNTSWGWNITKNSAFKDYGNFAQCTVNTMASSEPTGDWLISPALNFDKTGKYKVSYKAQGASYYKVSFDVRLGTDINNTESFSIVLDTHENETINNSPWKTFEQEFTIETAGYYFVGVYEHSTPDFTSLKIDDIAIEYVGGKTTGISQAVTDKQKGQEVWYNLNGQRVSKPAKGIYIRDGKKFLIK